MKKLLLIIFLFLAHSVIAQTGLPVIRANAGTVKIRDGNTTINDWELNPKLKPDVYYTNIPRKNGRITFITDLDSIGFNTSYGNVYDFVILLNGKDSCYTRVSAKYTSNNNSQRIDSSKQGPVIIPFTLHGSRMYFNGKMNGRKDIAIQFDLGAGGSCVNINSVEKTGVKFDGKIMLTNSHGTNEAPTSSGNKLEIGGLSWTIPVVQTDNMDRDEDIIIGNSLFRDKIIEIDYDKKVMTVYDKFPRMLIGYTSHDVIYEQHRPKVQTSVIVADHKYTDWFLFDTGRDGSMVIGDGFVGRFGLWDKFYTILNMGNKKIVRIAEVSLGALTFRDIVTNAGNPAKPTGRPSLLGNELLNHFNLVLDNKAGIIYLKPNSLQNNPYSDWTEFKFMCTVLSGIAILVITVIVLLVRMWRKRMKAIKTIK